MKSKTTTRANQLKKLASETNKVKNLFLNNWIENNIYKPIEEAVKNGLQKSQFRIKMSPYKLEELGKVGGNLEILKTVVYQQGFDLVVMKGWREFDDSSDDTECIQLNW